MDVASGFLTFWVCYFVRPVWVVYWLWDDDVWLDVYLRCIAYASIIWG